MGTARHPWIQLLVCVSSEGVMKDYLRTNDYFEPRLVKFVKVVQVAVLSRVSPERTRPILMAHPELLSRVHDTIVKQCAVETHLRKACGIDQDVLQKLEDRPMRKPITPRATPGGARATPQRPRRAG